MSWGWRLNFCLRLGYALGLRQLRGWYIWDLRLKSGRTGHKSSAREQNESSMGRRERRIFHGKIIYKWLDFRSMVHGQFSGEDHLAGPRVQDPCWNEDQQVSWLRLLVVPGMAWNESWGEDDGRWSKFVLSHFQGTMKGMVLWFPNIFVDGMLIKKDPGPPFFRPVEQWLKNSCWLRIRSRIVILLRRNLRGWGISIPILS